MMPCSLATNGVQGYWCHQCPYSMGIVMSPIHPVSSHTPQFGAKLHPKSADPIDCLSASSPEELLKLADACDEFTRRLETVEDGVDPLTVKFEREDGSAKATVESTRHGSFSVDKNESYGNQYFLDTVMGEIKRFAAELKSPTELEQEGVQAALETVQKFTTQMAQGKLTHDGHVDHDADRTLIQLERDGETAWIVRQNGKNRWQIGGNKNLIRVRLDDDGKLAQVEWSPLLSSEEEAPPMNMFTYYPQHEKFSSPLARLKELQWKNPDYTGYGVGFVPISALPEDLRFLNTPLEDPLEVLSLEAEQLAGQLKNLFEDIHLKEAEGEIFDTLEGELEGDLINELEEAFHGGGAS